MMPQLESNPAIAAICKTYRVKSLHLFGSFADGVPNDQSDIDFIVEFDRDGFHGAFDQFMGLKSTLEAELARPVDLISASARRNKLFKAEINRAKQLIYAA